MRPNAQYEGSPEETQSYEPSRADYEAGQESYRQMAMQQPSAQHMMATGHHPKPAMYAPQSSSYPNHQAVYPLPPYGDATGVPQHMSYGSMPPVSVLDQSYPPPNVFPTPPLPEMSGPHSESSPESYHTDQYGGHDLADLLGPLKLDERGTGELIVC